MKNIPVGGQAVMEGVMIKSPNYVVVSVRKKDDKIVTKIDDLKKKSNFMKFPFVRGVVNLVEMLIVGIKALTWSANQVEEVDEQLSSKEIFWTIFFSFVFGVLLFVALPFYLTKFMVTETGLLFNLLDGLIRILIFVLYVYIISFMDDVKLLFQYHGAEHKAIHCYENNKELNIENIKPFNPVHPRCGTAFIAIVLVISIFVFSILKDFVWYWNVALRILLIPVIAAISYELLKAGDKRRNNWFFKILVWPGLAMQKITTSEPTDKQIDVAIDALKKALSMEKSR